MQLAPVVASVFNNLYLRPLSIDYGQVALGTALNKGFTLMCAGSASAADRNDRVARYESRSAPDRGLSELEIRYRSGSGPYAITAQPPGVSLADMLLAPPCSALVLRWA
jgi:hypothetical protein